ncbi:MAG: sialidase family protein [Acidobacteriota bacterium]
MSAFDRRTGDAWIGGVTFFTDGAVYVARRRAGAGSFDAPVLVNGDPDLFYDKPLMTAGPGPGAPNTTRLYVTYSEGLQSSGDLGATWGPLVELGESLFEIAYQPRVDADGVLSIVSWDSGDTIWLRRSLDGGATVGPRRAVATRLDVWGLQDSSRVPGQFRAPSLPSLAVDADGSLYVAYADTTSTAGGDANLDIYLTRSTDGGVTWSTPRIVNGDAVSPGDQFAPWLEVDAAGRLHVLFFDTRFTPQSDGADFGLVDLSYAFSDDAGASWREVRITDAPSSSADAVWVGGPNVADYQFLGDYLGLTALEDGDVAVVYPAAVGGDFDIYSRRLRPPLFVDGFVLPVPLAAAGCR